MIKKTVKLELEEVMLCKDIQQNRNGTFSLLGVYPKDVAITAQTPVNFSVSLWLNFLSFLPEDVVVEVKISGKGVLEEEVVIPVDLVAREETREEIAVPIILKNIPLKVLKAGEIQISYKKPKAKWKAARTVWLNITAPE